MKIHVIDDFLSSKECGLIRCVATMLGEMKDSTVSLKDGPALSSGRISEHCWIDHSRCHRICESIAVAAQLPLSTAERLQVVHYPTGGKYNPHYDAFSPEKTRCLAHGQRIRTALIYLNTPVRGGGTDFPRLKQTIEAKEGRLVMWDNVIEGTTERNPDSLHAGLPVEDGEKWVCNLWFRSPAQ